MSVPVLQCVARVISLGGKWSEIPLHSSFLTLDKLLLMKMLNCAVFQSVYHKPLLIICVWKGILGSLVSLVSGWNMLKSIKKPPLLFFRTSLYLCIFQYSKYLRIYFPSYLNNSLWHSQERVLENVFKAWLYFLSLLYSLISKRRCLRIQIMLILTNIWTTLLHHPPTLRTPRPPCTMCCRDW